MNETTKQQETENGKIVHWWATPCPVCLEPMPVERVTGPSFRCDTCLYEDELKGLEP